MKETLAKSTVTLLMLWCFVAVDIGLALLFHYLPNREADSSFMSKVVINLVTAYAISLVLPLLLQVRKHVYSLFAP
jgi:quinol-cytochrome oxidoreductase complex cytochrome b subunit